MRLSLIDAIGTRNNILFQNIQFSRVSDETDLEFTRDDRNICLFTISKLSFPWVPLAKREQKLKISPHIGNLVWHMWVSVDQASCLYQLSQILFWKGENATKIGLTMLWWRQWIAREEPRCQRRKVAVKRDGRRGQLVLVKRDGRKGGGATSCVWQDF